MNDFDDIPNYPGNPGKSGKGGNPGNGGWGGDWNWNGGGQPPPPMPPIPQIPQIPQLQQPHYQRRLRFPSWFLMVLFCCILGSVMSFRMGIQPDAILTAVIIVGFSAWMAHR